MPTSSIRIYDEPVSFVSVLVRRSVSVLLMDRANQAVRESASPRTVNSFAAELRKPPEVLLEQLKAAGVPKVNVDSALSERDLQALLEHLQRLNRTAAGDRKPITLTKGGHPPAKQRGGQHRATKDPNPVQEGRINKVILIGNLGRTSEKDEAVNELVRAFLALHKRLPLSHEVEKLKGYLPRLEALHRAAVMGDRDALCLEIRKCFFEVNSPQIYAVLETLALRLISPRFHNVDIAQVLIAWEAAALPLIPTPQKVKGVRADNTVAAVVAWRLRRHKRFFPASVATIALN